MTEENPVTPENQNQEENASSTEAWREVGKQFQVLGESISEAVRLAWYDEENRRRVQEIRDGLERMVTDIDSAIRAKAASSESQKFQAEVKKAAENLRDAGSDSVQEIRPHLVSALKQVNNQLQKWVDQMEDKDENPPSAPTE